jgi:hypothetical protein
MQAAPKNTQGTKRSAQQSPRTKLKRIGLTLTNATFLFGFCFAVLGIPTYYIEQMQALWTKKAFCKLLSTYNFGPIDSWSYPIACFRRNIRSNRTQASLDDLLLTRCCNAE